MCGICGFIYADPSREPDAALLDGMVDRIAHRGPDGRGSFIAKGGALGHRRLTIIDLVGGHQPMELNGGVITYNGEIYNYVELRERFLQGATLDGTSDTTVLLNLLAQRGGAAVGELNGMFAFAYWDRAKRSVTLARDPVGQKPLFYYFDEQCFVFSSDLRSLALHPAVPTDIDREALAHYLLFESFPHPFTPMKGVRKMQPGHVATLDIDRWTLSEERYWHNPIRPQKGGSEEDYVDQFDGLFRASVDRHLRSDVDVGVFLSGGLDSPSLVKAAVELRGGNNVRTFTIRHEIESYNEAEYAKEIADHYGTQHHERLLSQSDLLSNILPILDRMDEPIADPGFIAIYQVVKFSREFVKVILSGNGGDEFYAGYAPFKALTAQRWASSLMPQPLVKLARWLVSLPPASHDYMNLPFKAERFLRGVGAPHAELLYRWIGSFNDVEIRQLLKDAPAINVYEPLYRGRGESDVHDPVSSLLQSFQQHFLTNCICNHADKASMIESQELRSPFLDTELMRFANRLPPWMQFQRGQTKYLVRKYLDRAGLQTTSRRAKRGFTVPIASWLTTALKSWAEELLDPQLLATDGFFEPAVVRRLWDEHQSRLHNHAKPLWTLLVFQHWLHRVFPKMKGPIQ